MSHLKALQTLQKDKLKAHGASVGDGWAFPNELGTALLPGDDVNRVPSDGEGCADVRPISFHGCRHTCATLMLKAGQPVHVVSRVLGPASVQITLDYYAHVTPGQDERAVVALVAMYS